MGGNWGLGLAGGDLGKVVVAAVVVVVVVMGGRGCWGGKDWFGGGDRCFWSYLDFVEPALR